MFARASSSLCLLLAALLAGVPPAGAQKKTKKKPTQPEVRVENYYGGIFLMGQGDIPNGPCFRINGRVTSGDFFNDLKSYESDDGVSFRRGENEVTQFPDKLLLALTIRDEPCDLGLQPVGTGRYLTPQAMSKLKLTFYWKRGVDLRPVGKIALVNSAITPIQPYATDLADELPKKYLWTYELGIPAENVPLTDSLVLVFRNAEGRIVARVAARL